MTARIFDPHVHLYPRSRGNGYGIDELTADTRGVHDVIGAIYIEAANAYRSDGPAALQPVGETEWIEAVDDGGVIAGIVAYADLGLGDGVEDVLEAHRTAGGTRLCGVRYRPNWDASNDVPNSRFADRPGLLSTDAVARGAAVVGRLDLTLDLFVYHHQLGEVERMARACPDVRIVVDHFGAPLGIGPYADRREEVLTELRRRLDALSRCANVHLKLGGLGWPGHGLGWETRSEPPGPDEVAEAWAPLAGWCIDTFGADRCMCESNYPADRPSLRYRTIWDAHLLMTNDLGEHDRAAVLCETAMRVYGIAAV